MRMTAYRLGDREPSYPPDGEYWIAPNAIVAGNVILKKNASVWFGAVLRGDNEPIIVGENSNIQDNSVCHTDMGSPLTIGDNVTIGHMVMLHGCTIGDGALIVGSPAKVVRELAPEHAARMGMGALHYVENWRRFKKGLAPA